MEEIRRRWMRLAVALTDEELETKKRELVDWTRTRAQNEAEMEAWVAEMKEEKKLMEATIVSAGGYANRAANIIKSGEEDRDVEVSDNFDGGSIVTLRLDTGEIVSTRPANDDERQLLLAMPQANVGELKCICKNDDLDEVDCPIHGVIAKREAEGDGSTSDAVS
jgi:hypothetical protein